MRLTSFQTFSLIYTKNKKVESKDKFQQLNEKLNCQNEQTGFTLFYFSCIEPTKQTHTAES